jgi:hypothetical protein
MANLPNNFTWSISRCNEYQSCKRKYFYNKYASWGGWETRVGPARNELAKQCYYLKNLDSISAWRGESVHYAIGRLLQGKVEVSNVIEKTHEWMTRQWDKAVQHYESDPMVANPKTLIFLEHVENGVNHDDLSDARHIAAESIQAVIDQDIHTLFSNARKNDLFSYVETEYPSGYSKEKFDRLSISVKLPKTGEPIRVFTMPDCAVESDDGSFYIFDWKVKHARGEDEQKPRQVRLYAAWLMQELSKRQRAFRKLEVYTVHLPYYELHGGLIAKSEINETIVSVKKDVAEMHDLHLKLVDDKDWPGIDEVGLSLCMAEPSSTCRICSFSSICDTGKEFLAS